MSPDIERHLATGTCQRCKQRATAANLDHHRRLARNLKKKERKKSIYKRRHCRAWCVARIITSPRDSLYETKVTAASLFLSPASQLTTNLLDTHSYAEPCSPRYELVFPATTNTKRMPTVQTNERCMCKSTQRKRKRSPKKKQKTSSRIVAPCAPEPRGA